MNIKKFCVLISFLLLLFACGAVSAEDIDFCPALCSHGKVSLSSPLDNTPVSTQKFSVPRNQVLLEIFTATWCQYCPYSAVAADSLGKLKGDSLAVLQYHHTDGFSNPDGEGRYGTYYGIPGTPAAKFDGRRTVMGGTSSTFDNYLTSYDMEMDSASACTLVVFVKYDSTTRFLKVKTKTAKVDAFTNAHLRYAIAENNIYTHWGGPPPIPVLDSVQNVVRKMLPDYNGLAIPYTLQTEHSFVDSQTCTLPPDWNDKNCYVAVFVQNDDSPYPVFRSAKSGLFPTWMFGDANRDKIVDIGDVMYLIGYLFKSGPLPKPLAAGDANGDCIVDIGDVMYLIGYLFKAGPIPKMGCAW